MYYLLECFGPIDCERQAIDTIPAGISWMTGRPIAGNIPDPLEVIMDGDGIMLPMFNRGILVFREDMVAALQNAGVVNIMYYNVHLIDPVKNIKHGNYKAANIIGLIAAADLKKSIYNAPSGVPIIDTDFEKLVIDNSKCYNLLVFRLAESVNGIVVHEQVKKAIETANIPYINFVEPEKWFG